MKEYTGDKIRNVAIVGHGGAGTTSVTEALLYRSGAISRMCKVEDGATTTDYEPEEIKRKVSVNATLAPVEWRNTKINFIDTPGFADFVAEVKGAFRAVDSALIVVCATSGVQVGTEQCWKLAEEANLPRIIFVNKMDRENADFDSILDNLRGKFGKCVLPLELPLGTAENFEGVIDLYKMKAYRANGNDSDEIEIPDEYKEAAQEAREKMIEAAVEADDDCMMRYLDGETISDEEIMKCLIKGIRQATIFPMICGSAYKDIGLGRLMNAIVDFTYPAILNDFIVMDKETGEEEIRDANAPMSALVFKTTSDPFVGRLSFFRVFSGSIKSDSVVFNSRREEEERIGAIFTMRGKTQIPMKEVVAGDIGVVAKLQFTSTGDTLCDKNAAHVEFPPIAFPLPMYTRAIYAKKKGDEDKISAALSRLMDEDPTIIVTKNPVTKETLISGMGDQHIEIIMERMQRKFGVEADLRAPIIEYRETIRGRAEVEGKHKKQSGEKFDYSKIRTPKMSGLKSYELKYIDNDVLGLEEALEAFFQIENDNVWTIPLTKTGFVRRDLKEALKKISYKKRLSWQLDYDSFKACEEAFRGGNTHASRFYADPKVIVKDCYSNDFASSYPFVMLTSNHFPKRNFTRKGKITLDDFFYYTVRLFALGDDNFFHHSF